MTKATDDRAFKAALKNRRFDPSYYLYGEDDVLKETAVRELLAVAVEPATRAFNLDQRKGGEIHGEELGVLLGTPPMMASRRVIVIRDVGALRKDARMTVDGYLKAPSPDTVLVLVAASGDKPDKTLAEHATAVEYPRLVGGALQDWIVQRVKQAGAEATITAGAISLLQDVVGPDLSLLGLEIEKLLSYCNSQPITEEAVAIVVGVRREETLGHLLDSIAQRDAVTALAALTPVLQQPKTSAVVIVMALTVQMLALAWGQSRGLHPARLSKEYFDLLKETRGAFPGRAWGEAVSAWTKSVGWWNERDLDDALSALTRADAALKESRLSTEEQLLTSLVLTLCRSAARKGVAR